MKEQNHNGSYAQNYKVKDKFTAEAMPKIIRMLYNIRITKGKESPWNRTLWIHIPSIKKAFKRKNYLNANAL